MSDQPHQPIPPPPKGSGVFGKSEAPPRPVGSVIPNRNGQLIKDGFFTGIGIALAFMAISFTLWLVAAILFALALS